MLAWIMDNLATIIVCAILIAIVAAIVISMVRNKKKGKFSCSGGCAHCSMNGACHPKQ